MQVLGVFSFNRSETRLENMSFFFFKYNFNSIFPRCFYSVLTKLCLYVGFGGGHGAAVASPNSLAENGTAHIVVQPDIESGKHINVEETSLTAEDSTVFQMTHYVFLLLPTPCIHPLRLPPKTKQVLKERPKTKPNKKEKTRNKRKEKGKKEKNLVVEVVL